MDIKNKVNILLNILSALCELAERDATFFLPQKGNEIDYEESVKYLVREIQITSRRIEEWIKKNLGMMHLKLLEN